MQTSLSPKLMLLPDREQNFNLHIINPIDRPGVTFGNIRLSPSIAGGNELPGMLERVHKFVTEAKLANVDDADRNGDSWKEEVTFRVFNGSGEFKFKTQWAMQGLRLQTSPYASDGKTVCFDDHPFASSDDTASVFGLINNWLRENSKEETIYSTKTGLVPIDSAVEQAIAENQDGWLDALYPLPQVDEQKIDLDLLPKEPQDPNTIRLSGETNNEPQPANSGHNKWLIGGLIALALVAVAAGGGFALWKTGVIK